MKSLDRFLANRRSKAEYVTLSKAIPNAGDKIVVRPVPFSVSFPDKTAEHIKTGEIMCVDERFDSEKPYPFYAIWEIHEGFKNPENPDWGKSYRCLQPWLDHQRVLKSKKGKKAKKIKCPFCEYADYCVEHEKLKHIAFGDYRKGEFGIRKSMKMMFNFIDPNVKEPKLQILVLRQSTIVNTINAFIEDFGNIAHPKKGRAIKIVRKSTKGSNQYQVTNLDPAKLPQYSGKPADVVKLALITERPTLEEARQLCIEHFGFRKALGWPK